MNDEGLFLAGEVLTENLGEKVEADIKDPIIEGGDAKPDHTANVPHEELEIEVRGSKKDDSVPVVDNDDSNIEPNNDGEDTPGEQTEFFILGEHWKQMGIIDEDVEIPTDITSEKLEEIYREQIQENVSRTYKTQYSDILEKKGIDPEDIFGNRGKKERAADEYRQIGAIAYDDIVDNTDDPSEAIKRVGVAYFGEKNPNLSEKEILSLVEKDMEDLYEEEAFGKYRDYFKDRADELDKEVEKDRKQAEKKAIEQQQKNETVIKSRLKERKIGGSQITQKDADKLYDAIFKKDQIYDDGEKRRKVSLYEKKRLESMQDIDKQLAIAAFLILGMDQDKIEEISERRGAINMLNELASYSQNSGKKKKTNDSPGIPGGLFIE